jgi:pimeloyl-ACP methyl ester carboxylesterase
VTTPDPVRRLARAPVEVDVSDLVPSTGPGVVRGWVLAPVDVDRSGPATVVCCLPGGKCTTGYFDLQVEGFPGYSMAEHLAAAGCVVVALDHPGTGGSSPVEDLFVVTPGLVAAVNDRAHREVLSRLADGTALAGVGQLSELRAVGLGHSMGGMLATVQQARHHTFAALVGLGHGNGLAAFVSPEERDLPHGGAVDEDALVDLARRRSWAVPTERRPLASGTFLPTDLPAPVRHAFLAQQTVLPPSCGLASIIPGSTDSDKAAVTVPVFLGFGEHDLTREFLACASKYTATRDLTVFVLPGAAHCHNQAHNRVVLWDRILTWTGGLPPAG